MFWALRWFSCGFLDTGDADGESLPLDNDPRPFAEVVTKTSPALVKVDVSFGALSRSSCSSLVVAFDIWASSLASVTAAGNDDDDDDDDDDDASAAAAAAVEAEVVLC